MRNLALATSLSDQLHRAAGSSALRRGTLLNRRSQLVLIIEREIG